MSKLPDVGTTIFTVISRRAAELGAVNLGQGFPDYPIDPRLTELVGEAMRAGHNQYAPMAGLPELREAIARVVSARHGIDVDPEQEVTVTVGATEAIFSAIAALVGPGDEVLVFDPAYDSYDPAVRVAGATCVHVPLAPPAFRCDWDRVREAITPRTKLVVINTPQNPACTVMSADDLAQLAQLAEAHGFTVLSDEVYEHIVHAPARHHSVLAHPVLRQRALAVYSFGKSLHATGLRVGYCIAPPALTAELRKVHQFNTFTITTAFQHAIAAYITGNPGIFAGLGPFFAAKRELLTRGLADSAFQVVPAQGSYFTLVDYSRCELLAGLDDMAAAERLLVQGGVAAIPLAPFYRQPVKHSLLRLCFAKQDDTLARGVERLQALR
ncbi:MAG TPA: methionine aminotransferase [Steroidobacteraceae bacterium]|nr:methionine aminotransferase [Steroidobacteraceae bacterium]